MSFVSTVHIFSNSRGYATKNSWNELFTFPLKEVYVANKFHPGGCVQRVVHALKYRNRPDVARGMGRIMAEHLPNKLEGTFLPVPQTPQGLRKRGYNQAALIANAIASVVPLSVNYTLLSRSGRYKSQTSRGRLDRMSSIHMQLTAHPKGYERGTVWLVDDVLTTGATVNACLDKLWAAGIKDLGVIVWASA